MRIDLGCLERSAVAAHERSASKDIAGDGLTEHQGVRIAPARSHRGAHDPTAVANAEGDGSARTQHTNDDNQHNNAQPPERDGRPPWLEPYGGSREWRGLMWAAIVGLHTRYPEALATLKEGWWRNPTQLETLSALAVWRKWIDDAGGDPREELAFQVQLANYANTLRQAGGSITRV
jgi:hypothetical protein